METYQNTQGSYGQRAMGGRSMDYTVDMVFCIDATGSMEDTTGSRMKVINMVKQNALNFYSDFDRIMTGKNKKVRQLRVRIAAFREYLAYGADAMMATDFFMLPQQEREFEACINSSMPMAAATSPRTAWRRWPMPLSPSGPPRALRSARSSWCGPMPVPTILASVPAPSIIPRVCPQATPN